MDHVMKRLGQLQKTVRLWFAVGLAISAGVGCNEDSKSPTAESKSVAKCRVVKDGVPVQPRARNPAPGESGMELIFTTMEGDDVGKRYSAVALSDQPGTFELVDQQTKPIPPGKYRVAVLLGRGTSKDGSNDKFGLEQSPIVVEVKEGEDLTIDLAKYP
jgi:hypothetical protein